MRILVSNDDGITAGGIRLLAKVAKEFGEVTVVAPNKPQSAKGHAVTFTKPLRLKESAFDGGLKAYACSGTPADCVKIALDHLYPEKPDLCLSGINHGSNASINIVYSGTMAAAMEAAIGGVNSIGFSFLNYFPDADMSACEKYVRLILEKTINQGFPASRLINVNIPDLPEAEIKGLRVCQQARAHWKEDFDKRSDPYGSDYFWMKGNFVMEEGQSNTDIQALEAGFVSVVPCQFDLTSYKDLDSLNKKWA